MQENQSLYEMLQRAGYVLQFKEVSKDHTGKAKGNVDVDLTLRVIDKLPEYDRAVLSPNSIRHCSPPTDLSRYNGPNDRRGTPWARETSSTSMTSAGSPVDRGVEYACCQALAAYHLVERRERLDQRI